MKTENEEINLYNMFQNIQIEVVMESLIKHDFPGIGEFSITITDNGIALRLSEGEVYKSVDVFTRILEISNQLEKRLPPIEITRSYPLTTDDCYPPEAYDGLPSKIAEVDEAALWGINYNKTPEVMWKRQELEERIALLQRKYYPGYVDPNPAAAIYKFQAKLKELLESGKDEIAI